MGDNSDLTVEILKQIRDGAAATGERLESEMRGMREELGVMNGRLDGIDGRLGRVEQGLTDVGTFMKQIAKDLAVHEKFHHKEMRDDMNKLTTRMDRIEQAG